MNQSTRHKGLPAVFSVCSAMVAGLVLASAGTLTGDARAQSPAPANAPCSELGLLSAQETPATLYPRIAACIKQGDDRTGMSLLSLAGVYGKYDRLRVTDRAAHQVIPALRQQWLVPTDAQAQSRFQNTASRLTDNAG